MVVQNQNKNKALTIRPVSTRLPQSTTIDDASVGRFVGGRVRIPNRLTALFVSRAKAKGMYPDGDGLYLQVTASSARSWIYRYMLHGRAREMGLGSLREFSLAEARIRAAECRKLRADGIDPIDRRRAARSGQRLATAKAMTFEDAAKAYIEANSPGWRNEKQAVQWTSSLKMYAYPVFGSLPVQDIDTALVMKVLEPIWKTKTETASRVRGRIEAVLDWAKARDYRTGENPAVWRGHIENLLPARSRVKKVKHHPALPYDEIGDFVKLLRGCEGTAARAFGFLILTAARTSEVVGAQWDEVDLEKATWIIPADRIKAGREHRVPLSQAALSVLQSMEKNRQNKFVFPGGQQNQSLSNMALLALLKRIGKTDITAHGFRSTFRDWAAERTNYPREVAEMALAHAIGDKVEAAYRRGDLFEKRRRLMHDWANYCNSPKPAGQVVAIKAARQ
ncbi:MAG: tyrosine-type recombinase/integrase [Alphaproteobacteria bacterium]|nr:tyrosine-type recombinase/integrase [Alphaproteobacteria bacterium]